MSEYLTKLSQCDEKRDYTWYSQMYMDITQYSWKVLDNPDYPREKYYHMGKLFNCLINQKNTYPTKHEISKIRQGLYVPDSHFLDVSGYQSWDLERLIREFNKWQGHVDVGKQITSEEFVDYPLAIDMDPDGSMSIQEASPYCNESLKDKRWYRKSYNMLDRLYWAIINDRIDSDKGYRAILFLLNCMVNGKNEKPSFSDLDNIELILTGRDNTSDFTTKSRLNETQIEDLIRIFRKSKREYYTPTYGINPTEQQHHTPTHSYTPTPTLTHSYTPTPTLTHSYTPTYEQNSTKHHHHTHTLSSNTPRVHARSVGATAIHAPAVHAPEDDEFAFLQEHLNRQQIKNKPWEDLPVPDIQAEYTNGTYVIQSRKIQPTDGNKIKYQRIYLDLKNMCKPSYKRNSDWYREMFHIIQQLKVLFLNAIHKKMYMRLIGIAFNCMVREDSSDLWKDYKNIQPLHEMLKSSEFKNKSRFHNNDLYKLQMIYHDFIVFYIQNSR